MRSLSVVSVFLLLIAAVSISVAQTEKSAQPKPDVISNDVDINTLLERIEQAQVDNRARSRAYIVTRDYRMYNSDSDKPASEVVAEVNFVPPDRKTFDIKEATGSSRGEKVVRNILEHESQNAPHFERTALTRDNYDFQYLGEETFKGHPCYVLKLNPKRREKDLVNGRAWIDAKTYLIHRVEGELSKSPSWWLKSVHLTLDFNDVAGMWLETHTRARAEVRLFGEHSLESQALNYQTAETTAQKVAPRTKPIRSRPMRPQVVVGTAVLIRH